MPTAYVQDVRLDDYPQMLLFKIGRLLAAATTGYSRLHVQTSEKQATGAPTSSSVSTAGGDVLTLAEGERAYVQNLGTNPLFVRRAAGATSSSFHYVLAAGSGADDGRGGSLAITDHVGVVSVAGTSPRFIAWKVLA